jgi:hypothetical protein
MHRTALTAGAIIFLGIFLQAQDYKVEKKEEIRKTLKFADPSAAKTLEIDNVFGSIEISGADGGDIELIAFKTSRAASPEDLKQAEEDVRLDISQERNDVSVYVDGPFRCRNRKRRTRPEPKYQVQFDFRVKVPHKIDLYLKNVTNGLLRVANVEGELEVRNVNGGIEITEAAGPVRAQTVNGEMKVLFNHTPREPCSFKTLNGKLDLFFPENLRADFRLKTFNGEVYSDFPVTRLPSLPPTQEREGGKFVYRSDRFFGVRVGGPGGPEIKLDTFNGDIFINKKKA